MTGVHVPSLRHRSFGLRTVRVPPRTPRHLAGGSAAVALGHEQITIVSGPAGTGKTALLDRWYADRAARGECPVWVTLDRHNRPGTGRCDLRSILDEPLDPDTARVVFIDDADRLSRQVLDDLARSLPGPQWQLVLAGRTQLRPPILPGESIPVQFVGPEQLWLADDDIIGVLRAHRGDLPLEGYRHLAGIIDGWAAGADIVGRALADAAVPAAVITEPNGRIRVIDDYFEREVMAQLIPSDREFLTTTAVLREPSGQICDAVLDTLGSAGRLAYLADRGALVVRGPDADSYQWMPMAREFLLERLERSNPAGAVELRQRASIRHLADGRNSEAVALAAETADWQAIVNIVLDAGLDSIWTGHSSELLAWLSQLPTAVIEREAGVAVVAALALWASEGHDAHPEIEDWLASAAATAHGRPPGDAASVAAAIDAVRAATGIADPATRLRLADRALAAEAGSGSSWAAFAYGVAGRAAYLDGESTLARGAINECLRIQTTLEPSRTSGIGQLLTSSVIGLLALIEIAEGETARADALIYSSGLTESGTSAWGRDVATIRLAKGMQAHGRGDLETALESFLTVANGSLQHQFCTLGHLEAAAVHIELGGAASARRHLAEADALIDGLRQPGALLLQRRRQLASRSTDDTSADLVAALTSREAQVLIALDSDLTRREIADDLYLSHNTVKTYIQRLYAKLEVSSRPAAIARARQQGWL